MNKSKIIGTTIKIILTSTLIYLSYLETGKYTAICLSLIFLFVEMQTMLSGAHQDLLKEICNALDLTIFRKLKTREIEKE